MTDVETIDPWINQHHPMAFDASTDPDILYNHQILGETERLEFIKAMDVEIKSHYDRGSWVLRKRCDLPLGALVLPSVW